MRSRPAGIWINSHMRCQQCRWRISLLCPCAGPRCSVPLPLVGLPMVFHSSVSSWGTLKISTETCTWNLETPLLSLFGFRNFFSHNICLPLPHCLCTLYDCLNTLTWLCVNIQYLQDCPTRSFLAFPRNRAWVSPWGLKHTGFSDESDMGLRRRVQMSGSNEGYAFFFFLA